ncbi:MAG: acetyl-CoA carboxylase biotin carboxyl carrier protein [Alicyclobacillus sp.]|nr:acetyl-CoA carboxylase biotin carboxyl carrier protein [Alicyclobacillus sp.]
MFKIGEIRELIRLLDDTSIHELKVESDGVKLQIKKADPATPAPAPAPVAAPTTAATAFYPAPTFQVPAAGATATINAGEPSAAATTATSEPAIAADVHTITSPMVGTFYRAPSPEAPPFVEVGSKVSEKTVVCIVEAMKLMNEIEAEVKGEVVEILAENGQLVEYGQPLFRIRLA